MGVNATYIAAAADLFERMARFSSETGYIYGHCIIILVGFIAAYRTSAYGTSTASAYAGFWAFITSLFLWLAGWESSTAVVFCASFTLLVVLLRLLSDR